MPKKVQAVGIGGFDFNYRVIYHTLFLPMDDPVNDFNNIFMSDWQTSYLTASPSQLYANRRVCPCLPEPFPSLHSLDTIRTNDLHREAWYWSTEKKYVDKSHFKLEVPGCSTQPWFRPLLCSYLHVVSELRPDRTRDILTRPLSEMKYTEGPPSSSEQDVKRSLLRILPMYLAPTRPC